MRRPQVYAVVAAAAVVWAVLLLVQGVKLEASYARPYSLVVGAVVAIFEVFDRWLWRLGPIPSIVGRPRVRGTWKGTIQSSWIDPESGEQIKALDAFLVVKQTYSQISLRLVTAQSSSESLVSSLERGQNAVPDIQWTYWNTPKLLIQDRSRIHHGAAFVEVHGSPPIRLAGSYWTDRGTHGEMTFDGRSAELHSDFSGAVADKYA